MRRVGLYKKECGNCSLSLIGRPTALTFFLRIVSSVIPFVLVPLAMVLMPSAIAGAFLAILVCLCIGISIEVGTRRWVQEGRS